MDQYELNHEEDDVRAVRALAHPLRLKLLDLLRFEGPSTATKLAQIVGESSGATSYHLRMLARYGYVEEADQTDQRERWWKYRAREVTLPAVQDDAAEDSRLLASLLSREAHALDRYLAIRDRLPEWDDASFFRSGAVRLTPAELEQLRDGIMALIDGLRPADAPDAPPDARAVRLLVFGFPQPFEEPHE